MSVKRYEWMACDEHACHCDVVESAEGDMVDYEDYAALEARCAALAAENAGLKAALNPEVIPEVAVEAFTETVIMDHDWNEKSEWSWVENDTDVIRAVLEAIKPETPETDAFLAEVRAQGVEMFANHIFKVTGKLDLDDQKGADFCRDEAEDFAAQLRKGVQS
ncbi:hypothetical protein [Enterobacter cloacae]|uniref:Ead/Ea22-like family protein n=1 Tax=Enterobacter cloacae TaxID=550 RepID=A0AAW6NSA4_ENTCL|nr:hypothetical protein [Enterobacter cloacae]MDF3570892.1 hypothetical protein [Enterobacter cloacae]MDF3638650.1 hypothetical protein [Enterobacter cloacae]